MGNCALSAHPALSRRRSSSDGDKENLCPLSDEIPESDLGSLKVEFTDEEIANPVTRHQRLKREIERLRKMQQEEIEYIEDLRMRNAGCTGSVMRILHFLVGCSEPEKLLEKFEAHQWVILKKLQSLERAFDIVDQYLKARKRK